MTDEVWLALSTFPEAETAQRIAEQLVRLNLAACANILPGVRSIFHWEGKLEETAETLVLFKTTPDCFPALQTELRALHPYEVPEIIALRVADGLPAYLQWVSASCAPKPIAPPA